MGEVSSSERSAVKDCSDWRRRWRMSSGRVVRFDSAGGTMEAVGSSVRAI